MEDLTLAESRDRPAKGVPTQRASVRCDMMGVAYVPRIANTAKRRARDRIQIIIPGEQAAVHAACRTASGHEQTVRAWGHHVTVIPAGEPHAVHCARPGDWPADAVIISLDMAFFDQKAREAHVSEAPRLTGRYNAVDPFMREVGNALRDDLLMQRTPPRAYLESLATVIAIHLARNYCGAAAALPRCAGLPPHKLAWVQAYIRQNLAAPIRVQQMAAAVHMSTFHFARMFKETTGQPPHVYVTLQRMEYAKDLLCNGNLPLVDVAASAGFQTQGHFTGVFHRYAGVTPRIFRLSSRAARRRG